MGGEAHKKRSLSPEEWISLGEIGLEQGYWRQAEFYFERALKRAPNDPRALWGKARATRDPKVALALIERLLKEQPDHVGALEMRQRLEAQELAPTRITSEADISPATSSQVIEPSTADPASRVSRYRTTLVIALLAFLIVAAAVSLMGGRAWGPPDDPAPQARLPGDAVEPLPLAAIPTTPPLSTNAAAISDLQRAQLATVLILVPGEWGDMTRGSGTIVAPTGLILTNHHVVAEARQPGGGAGPYLAFVGLAQSIRRAPSLWYIAATVGMDPTRDLAALQVIARAENGKPVRGQSFESMVFGDSSTLELGQGVIGMGYPALGGDTLTLTRGSMAGFVTDHNGITYGKTDSELLPGSSGGAVLDDAGRLIGIVTAAYTDQRTQGRLSYFLLVQEADALLRQAAGMPRPQVDVRWAVSKFKEVVRQG
ncbi:MAG: trypsin-like peptidase domain-containing protein [Chloroflexi bacterium]|nr:trypsin-like peptidase domain-containing protein [Chloroflexota bacterium]